MSFLTEPLPDFVEISGKKYRINTDFRVWLDYDRVVASDMALAQKAAQIFTKCFLELPPTFSSGIDALMKFYSRPSASSGRRKTKGRQKKVFDFEYDAESIYVSFLAVYGINLTRVSLHWWEFISLFSGLLFADCQLSKIVSYRTCDIGKIKDTEHKQFMRRMQNIYRLPKEYAGEGQALADAIWNI